MPVTIQSALHPAGPGAATISDLWWLMFWTCTVVYVLVMTALVVAVRRRHAESDVRDEQRLVRRVVGATAATVLILVGLLVASVTTGRAVSGLASGDPLVIAITGNQWWWDVEYHNPAPSLRTRTANEIHLPTGRPVRILLTSNDVIHSFWVPNLHGKTDLIPGRRTELMLRVDTPGVYRGQCAEYCGLQHAHMAFTVIAVSSDDFERWLAAQRQPAPAPRTPEQQRGFEIVTRGSCAMCHTVRGTSAGARTAPDLTHLATRSTIAAGSVPNTRASLAGWIANPQHLKPGAKMPVPGLSAEDLEAVLAYLETLR